MSVSLPRLDEVPAQIMRYWPNSKPGPLSSKPGMSKAIVEPSTSKAIVEHSTIARRWSGPVPAGRLKPRDMRSMKKSFI
jgi:hypothetical protein